MHDWKDKQAVKNLEVTVAVKRQITVQSIARTVH